jgi:hypothetical protein
MRGFHRVACGSACRTSCNACRTSLLHSHLPTLRLPRLFQVLGALFYTEKRQFMWCVAENHKDGVSARTWTWGICPSSSCSSVTVRIGLSEIEGAQWLVELQLSQNEKIRIKEHKTKLDYVQINLVRKIPSLFKTVKKFKHLYFLNRQFEFWIQKRQAEEATCRHPSPPITTFYHNFFTDRPWRTSTPHLLTAVSRPAAKIQAFRCLPPPPHTRRNRPMTSHPLSPSRFASLQTESYRSITDHKTNVVMPPHHILHRWPSFNSSPLSMNT